MKNGVTWLECADIIVIFAIWQCAYSSTSSVTIYRATVVVLVHPPYQRRTKGSARRSSVATYMSVVSTVLSILRFRLLCHTQHLALHLSSVTITRSTVYLSILLLLLVQKLGPRKFAGRSALVVQGYNSKQQQNTTEDARHTAIDALQ